MSEAILFGVIEPGFGRTLPFGRGSSGVSQEAVFVQEQAVEIIRTRDTSVALFGRTSVGISNLMAVIEEAIEDPDQILPSSTRMRHAVDLLTALPSGVAMPDFALDPDGDISFDWIDSTTRMLSVSIGDSNRLAYAWLDGTDRGHAVVNFDGQSMPDQLLALLLNFRSDGDFTIRAA